MIENRVVGEIRKHERIKLLVMLVQGFVTVVAVCLLLKLSMPVKPLAFGLAVLEVILGLIVIGKFNKRRYRSDVLAETKAAGPLVWRVYRILADRWPESELEVIVVSEPGRRLSVKHHLLGGATLTIGTEYFTLPDPIIEAGLLHERGHKYSDRVYLCILVMVLGATLVLLFLYLVTMFKILVISGPLSLDIRYLGCSVLLIIYQIFLLLSCVLVLRGNERICDLSAVAEQGTSQPIIDLLNWLSEVMVPENRLRLRVHPTLERRLKYLRKAQRLLDQNRLN